MTRWLKLQHDEIYPNGEWRLIANEMEEGKVNDEQIYFYMSDGELDKLKIGDTVELDEEFKIIGVDMNEITP